MRILGVLDVMGGQVVRGIAGRRAEYRPVESRLVASCRPADVAQAFRVHLDLREIYLADLDAIAGAAPAVPLYQELLSRGFLLWVDAGLRTATDAAPLADAGVTKMVAGLETLAGPEELAALCRQFGAERIVFSLDLRGGEPLGDRAAWDNGDAAAVASRALALGVRSVILLDLTRVGTGGGTGTESLLQHCAQINPQIEWLVGGGVRHARDLQRLKTCGARGALVASALHDGRITREELAGI